MASGAQVAHVKLGQQARIYVRGLLGRGSHDRRFVVYCRGRDGSTLLVDLLNQLPGVHCDGEILHARVIAPRLYVRCCEALAPAETYGFKLLSHHLTHVQRVSKPAAFLRGLDSSGYRLIHLTRQNLLRQVLSALYVRHRGGYAGGYQHHPSSDGAPDVTQMSVDLEELHYWLCETERRARNEEASVSGLRPLNLVYERDLLRPESHQATVDRVAEYLGVPSARVKPGLARLTTDDLEEFVSNHEELVRFVERTDYGRFLSAS